MLPKGAQTAQGTEPQRHLLHSHRNSIHQRCFKSPKHDSPVNEMPNYRVGSQAWRPELANGNLCVCVSVRYQNSLAQGQAQFRALRHPTSTRLCFSCSIVSARPAMPRLERGAARLGRRPRGRSEAPWILRLRYPAAPARRSA